MSLRYAIAVTLAALAACVAAGLRLSRSLGMR